MKSRNSFWSMLKAEHYKTKYNLGFILILSFPIFITLCVDAYLVYEYSKSLPEATVFNYNPWTLMLGRHIFNFYSFFYPLIVSIFCYSLCDMETKQNNFKQLFTIPVSKQKIFLAKITLITEVVFLSVLVAYLMYMLSGLAMSYLMPRYCFQDFDIRFVTLVFFAKVFLGLLSIAFIQYFLSLLFRNFVFPLGIACFGVIFSLIATRWEYIDFVPYASVFRIYSQYFSYGSTVFWSKVEYINGAYILLFLGCIFYLFMRRLKNI